MSKKSGKLYRYIFIAGLVFLYLFPVFNVYSTSLNPDSFEYKSYGKEKLESLIQKSRSFLNVSPEQVRINAKKALELASANHDTTYMALSYSYLGASYVMDKMYDTAFILLKNAEYYALRIKDKAPLVRVYNNIATIYEQNRDFDKAFRFYLKSSQIINDNDLNDQYLPRLSLSKLYCMKDQDRKAIEILNKVIIDARLNSDIYFELLARLNLLEVKIIQGLIEADNASDEYAEISMQSLENNVYKIKNRLRELEIVLSIYADDLDLALKQAMHLPEKNYNDKRRKKQYLKKIQEKSYSLNSIKDVQYIDSLIASIENSIYSDYEYHLSKYNRVFYELSNQNMILEQINSDKNYIEKKLSSKNYFINVLLVICIVLSIVVLILGLRNLKTKDKEESSYEPLNLLSDSSQKDNYIAKIGYPGFILNSDYIYQEANNAFYRLSKKSGIESLRGCSDYDLPWKENAGKLVDVYETIKNNFQDYTDSNDLFNCNSEILFLPLLTNEQFTGIMGIVIPNQENKKTQNPETKMDKTESKNILKPRILIVDDEEDNIVLISRFLKNYNCDLKSTIEGKKALQLLQQEQFDVVLMDLEMPEMSGVEVVENIPVEIRKKIKIHAITAHARNEIKSSDIKLFDSIVSKPISKAKLVDKLSLSLNIKAK